ncbi:MAG TPA: sensor histidine kinase [Thermohalobaculum sp.]|nr:sensor histidine kinase [Thermohalobaculum sp.]
MDTETQPAPNGIWLSRFSLAQRFAIAGSFVMLAGSIALGSWVSNRITAGVVENTAIATALYMESFIAPLSQELARSDQLSTGPRQALIEIFTQTPLGERVISYKIWKKDGLIAFSSNPDLIGRQFEVSDHLAAAWRGEVVAEFEELDREENTAESALGLPLLEVYSPIRQNWSGEVIAVAEFYENGETLKKNIADAQRTTWLVVAAIVAAMAALLFGIVLGGSQTIIRQQGALRKRVEQLSEMAEQNRALRVRVQRASSRAAALNERYLRRIGADLHDGPAQLLAFASLRLDRLADGRDEAARLKETTAVRASLDKAMQDIRGICRGLTMPEIEEMSLTDVITRAVDAHESASGTEVALSIDGDLPENLDHSEKICVYRFVQEGLSNAYRHAGGAGQKVALTVQDDRIDLAVSDKGPGLNGAHSSVAGSGLGLPGLRERVESLGGTFAAENAPEGGARIVMTLPRQEGH